MTAVLDILFSTLLAKFLMYFLAFASIFLLVYLLFPNEEQIAAQKVLGMEGEQNKPTKTGLLRMFYPVYSMIHSIFLRHYAPKFLQNWIQKTGPQYSHRLLIANLRDEISAEEFIAFKFCMTIVIPVLFFYILGAMGYAFQPPMIPIMMVLGFLAPDFWLREITSKRRKEILKALPYTLDLLTLSVEAGMDFVAAIQRLTQRTKQNAMVDEFEQMLKEIRLGTSRSDALRNMSLRLEIEEVSSFTTLLIQADQLGSSIGDVLRAQSDQLRSKRFQNAEAAGARASQLILFPLIFCIFPAVFIVVLGPTILNMLSQGIFQ